MKYSSSYRQGLLLCFLALSTLPAGAGQECDAPVSKWQSREALMQWAATQGWQVQRVKIGDGCYEVRGTDAQGRAFKAKVDPETLKVLKTRHERKLRAQEGDRGDEGQAPRGQIQ